jgi:hypothetical protein
MKGLTGPSVITDFNPFATSTVKLMDLGQKVETSDGRIFRYGKAGSGGVTVGYLGVMPDLDTTEITAAVTATAAIGATSITFTHPATTATKDQYAGGYAVISYGTGLGQTLKIKSHAAFTSGGTNSVLYLEDPLTVALDTTSKLDIIMHPYSGVISVTTDAAVSVPCGVPLVTVAASSYGWFQTRGVVSLAADATLAVGYEIQGDVNDAGKADVTGTDAQVWKIGHAIQAGADTYSHAVFLTID